MAALRQDRVRRHTRQQLLQALDARAAARLEEVAGNPQAIEQRLSRLHREWDTDRLIELEAALVGLTGLAIGLRRRTAGPALTLAVGAAVLTHAIAGWYPLLPLFRRLGVRSAREIAHERHALKALRGDYDVAGAGQSMSTEAPPEASGEASGARLPPTDERVQRHSPPQLNAAIRARTDARVAHIGQGPPARRDERLRQLEREWDVERVLQANASTLVVTASVLGLAVDRRFLLLPAAVLGFFAQHALQGWCPPLPLLRRIGVRTVGEIERERQALKVLRGDYAGLPRSADPAARVRAVLAAVDR